MCGAVKRSCLFWGPVEPRHDPHSAQDGIKQLGHILDSSDYLRALDQLTLQLEPQTSGVSGMEHWRLLGLQSP